MGRGLQAWGLSLLLAEGVAHFVQALTQGRAAGQELHQQVPSLAWPHSVRGRPGLACKGLTSMLHAGEPAAHARPKKDAADAHMRRTLGTKPETYIHARHAPWAAPSALGSYLRAALKVLDEA